MIALIALSVLRACGGPQEGAGAGSECFRDADCNEGLICVERVCSNDVDALVSTVEGPSGEAAAVTGGVTSGTGAVETSSASSSTTMGSASTTGSTTGAGGTGATTTQGAAGAAGSP